jgi:hypothetical protein
MTTAVLLLAACGSAPAVTSLPQPPTASAVAAQLGATGFTDCGPAELGGVSDSGTAYKGGERIAVDTFPGTAQRDSWKKAVAPLGIAVAWQGADWVAYRVPRQAGRGCQ